ncbi:MAG: HAD-IIIA family hydrolase [Eubacterium sp.]|nr:HAD-IIIA family hydrolase [Eubacterium sp.]
MGRFLYPNAYFTSTYAIDFAKLYRAGFRGILFDIDNTLVPHDAMTDERSRTLLRQLREIGFSICFVSNNDEPRVANFVAELHVDGLPDPQYIFKAAKPRGQGYIDGIRKMDLHHSQVIFVGDQLLTDIWGANNAKLPSILVQPVAPETKLQIKLKRILEKPVIKMYLRKHPLREG